MFKKVVLFSVLVLGASGVAGAEDHVNIPCKPVAFVDTDQGSNVTFTLSYEKSIPINIKYYIYRLGITFDGKHLYEELLSIGSIVIPAGETVATKTFNKYQRIVNDENSGGVVIKLIPSHGYYAVSGASKNDLNAPDTCPSSLGFIDYNFPETNR